MAKDAAAPGRPKRAKRTEVPKVDKVDPYFDSTLNVETICGGVKTEAEVVALANA